MQELLLHENTGHLDIIEKSWIGINRLSVSTLSMHTKIIAADKSAQINTELESYKGIEHVKHGKLIYSNINFQRSFQRIILCHNAMQDKISISQSDWSKI